MSLGSVLEGEPLPDHGAQTAADSLSERMAGQLDGFVRGDRHATLDRYMVLFPPCLSVNLGERTD